MLVYYRFSGLLAVGGLALYMLYTLAALAGFDAVLTLPGIAGFVLSIGIAVDANVLIFERIREELDRGKTVRTAIDEGFRHAMPAIVDSNVSTILTAAVLYQYGTGAGEGLRRHAHRRYRRVARHLDLRGAHLLSPVAEPLARRPDVEHLRVHMLRILHDTKYDFIKHWRTRRRRHDRVHRARRRAPGVPHGAHRRRAELQHRVHRRHGGSAASSSSRRAADVVRGAVDQAGFTGAEVTTFGDPTELHDQGSAKAGERRSAPNADSVGAQIARDARSSALPANPAKVVRAEAVGAARRRRAEDEGDHGDSRSRSSSRSSTSRSASSGASASRPSIATAHDILTTHRVPRDDASRGLADGRCRASSP